LRENAVPESVKDSVFKLRNFRFRRDATSTHTVSAHDKRESESFLVIL
jgi:hypothetical protein